MRFRGEVGQSLTLKFAESAAKRRASGKSIISLGLGEPDFATPAPIVEAAQRVLGEGTSGYSSPMGLPGLREKISVKLQNENSIACDADNILVTAGAKQAFLIAAMAILEPDDEVVVVGPSFVSFVPQLCLAEPDCIIKEVNISKEDFSAPIDQITNTVSDKTKLVIINSPNNPAGYVFSESEMRSIFSLVKKHGSYLLSDEIYEKLNFSTSKHFSPGSLEAAPDQVITINGYSKSHAMTGWRLGYACIPANIKSKVLKIQQHMNTNTCTFIQQAMASIDFLDETYLEDYVAVLKARAETIEKWVKETPGISLVKPEAGFFAFINISELNISSNDFCGQLIEECGVATTPGLAFGEDWDDHVRLSFAVPEDVLGDGLERISQYLGKLQP